MGKREFKEFSNSTKKILAERVAYMCSNPLCRRLTIKPHTSKPISNKLGEAGHIIGAFGPRNNPNKDDSSLRHFENGIWLCNCCHKLVDTEESKYDSNTLIKWKRETEDYVETLVIQDTRLRQLRIHCQVYLSALRILSGLPEKLDHTFENPLGNSINITRLFIELELILFDNHFIEEANIIQEIGDDLNKIVCPFVYKNAGIKLNISLWKLAAVKVFMTQVMRFSDEAFERYVAQENEWVNFELKALPIYNQPKSLDISNTKIMKLLKTKE